MNPPSLSILPCMRSHEESSSLEMEREGFVDEAAVLALITGPRHPRSSACHEDLALAADDLDFAGWQLTVTPQPRAAEIPPRVIDAIVRRATPPVIEEPGIGAAHQGAHRWWLAGLAGVLSTMLFSILLLTLSSRPAVSYPPAHAPALAARPTQNPIGKTMQESTPTELTDASALHP